MCIVQLRCSVTSPVRVGERHLGQVEVGLADARPHERAVRTGDHPQLTRHRVGARHRDADGQPAAVVRVATDAAVLVPRDVGDAFGHADRLEQRLDAVARALGAEAVAGAGDGREAEEALVVEERVRAVRFAVEALHADEPRVAVGGARPPRSAVALGVRRCGAVHVGRDRVHLRFVEQLRRCAGSPRSRGSDASRRGRRRGRNARVRSRGRPSRSSSETDPGV